MTLRVVGVGLGRTGTNSLKLAFEHLLGAPCHHMAEVFEHAEVQVPLWMAAFAGQPDWPTIFDGYDATVDWPGAAFWRELTVEYPDALVVLSHRESADAWWKSASNTIFVPYLDSVPMPPERAEWFEALRLIFANNGVDPTDETSAKAAYEQHLADVRAEIPASRLVEWTPGDGWGPLCAGLGIAIPDEPFPHVNTTEQFRARFAERMAD